MGRRLGKRSGVRTDKKKSKKGGGGGQKRKEDAGRGRLVLLYLLLLLLLLPLTYFFIPSTEPRLHPSRVDGERESVEGGELERKLVESEQRWLRSFYMERADARALLHTPHLPFVDGSMPNGGRIFWSYFRPSFTCPYVVEQVGGDGGKKLCGYGRLKTLSACLIYSFRNSSSTNLTQLSFERQLLEETQCRVRLFDLKPIRPEAAELVRKFGKRVVFAQDGLGLPKANSLALIMRRWKDTFLDVLKVDLESGEWSGLEEGALELEEGVPVGEVVVGVDVERIPVQAQYAKVRSLFNTLQRRGLRPFVRAEKRSMFGWDYSFLSVTHGPLRIHHPPLETDTFKDSL